jgi:hypothetical protein
MAPNQSIDGVLAKARNVESFREDYNLDCELSAQSQKHPFMKRSYISGSNCSPSQAGSVTSTSCTQGGVPEDPAQKYCSVSLLSIVLAAQPIQILFEHVKGHISKSKSLRSRIGESACEAGGIEVD